MPFEKAVKILRPKHEKFLKKSLVGVAIISIIFGIAYSVWELLQVNEYSSAQTKIEHRHFYDDIPFRVKNREIIFAIGTASYITLTPVKPLKMNAVIAIEFDDPSIITTFESFTVKKGSTENIFVPLHSKKVAGHCTITFKSKSEELKKLYKLQIYVKVVHLISLGYLSVFLGWVYFVCWSMTYYPQIYKNFRRKSVVGLSFDYVALNLTGHLCYCVFNTAMFFNTWIQLQYTKQHPKGLLPVKVNDVLFSWHAVSMNLILIIQCMYYERGEQRISVSMVTLISGLWCSIVTGLLAVLFDWLAWLKYLYFLSYIKVATTPIKYTPQVYLHYIKKSTEGWSIYSVFLDLCGGLMSFLQMTIGAFNNDDIDETFGNPGKLGLSIIAWIFDGIFMYQHFRLYPYKKRMIMELDVPGKSPRSPVKRHIPVILSPTRRIQSFPKLTAIT